LLSAIPFENSVNRIDAEYFKKSYLKEDFLRSKYPVAYVGEYAFVTDGQHGYHEVDEASDIRHLTAKNFKNWFANDDNADRLAQWVDDQNKRSSLQKNDIVLTTRGTVGFCAIVQEDVLPANIDQDVARIAITNETLYPEYVVTYLNSKFGKDWTLRNQTGMVQQGLALWRVKQLPIPLLSNNFQMKIADIVKGAFQKITESKTTYTTAENILLSEIGLTDFTPSNDPVNIKNFSESFATSGRLDAEYYSMQSESVIRAITQGKYGAVPLHKVCKTQRGNLIPDTYYCDAGTKYIRGADFSANCLTDTGVSIDSSFQVRNETLTERGDIVFALIGSVGKLALVTEGFVGSFISNNIGLMRFIHKDFLPEYVHLFLTSKFGKILFDKVEMRTAQPKISDKDIWDFPIPALDITYQQQIAVLITQSFGLKKQSEHLLEVAKRAVEIAIEQDEAAAMAWIAAHALSA